MFEDKLDRGTPLVVREYLRVSQDSSKRGKSPQQQHKENVAAVTRHGWTVHDQPYQDTGIGASRYTRKARGDYQQLLSDLASGTFDADVLALWEPSRGSRRVTDWEDLLRLCDEAGVGIWVTTHRRLYDPANHRDRRTLREDAVDSEYETDKASERIRRDAADNAAKGRPHGKQLFGYQRIYHPVTRELQSVEPHPDQADVVRRAASMVLAGQSLYAVAKAFNTEGVPGRRARHASDLPAVWTGAAVKEMLTNPAYAGRRLHRGVDVGPAAWPALISPEDFAAIGALVKDRGTGGQRGYAPAHLLSGIALCGVCGSPVVVGKQNSRREGGPSSSYRVYVCKGWPGEKSWGHNSMRKEYLDAVVIEAVLHRIAERDFPKSLSSSTDADAAKRAEIQAEIDQRLAYLEDVHEMAAKERRLDLLVKQEALVRPELDRLQAQLKALVPTDPVVLDLAGVDDIGEAWDEMDLLGQRRVVTALVVPVMLKALKRGQRGLRRERVRLDWKVGNP